MEPILLEKQYIADKVEVMKDGKWASINNNNDDNSWRRVKMGIQTGFTKHKLEIQRL